MFQFSDQIFEIVGLARQFAGAHPLGVERFLARGLLLLALLDQRGHTRTLVVERGNLGFQLVAFGGDLLANIEQLGEVVGERLHLMPHLGQYRSQQHGGAHRLQSILRTGDQRRRRTVADTLECGQHFADHGAAPVERFANAAFIVVERLEPRFRRRDLRLNAADAAGGIDQVLVELAAIGAQLFDLALERGLGLDRSALRIAHSLEVLVVLLERVKLFRFAVLRHFKWRIIISENRLPFFGIQALEPAAPAPAQRQRTAIRAPAPR